MSPSIFGPIFFHFICNKKFHSPNIFWVPPAASEHLVQQFSTTFCSFRINRLSRLDLILYAPIGKPICDVKSNTYLGSGCGG